MTVFLQILQYADYWLVTNQGTQPSALISFHIMCFMVEVELLLYLFF